MSSYLSEAFKKLSFLKEEDFNLNDMEDIEDAKSFMDTPEDNVDSEVTVVDVDAPTKDDLLDSYVGKTILDCCVCHSKLYKNPEDVHIDEEGTLANVDEECPYCFSTDGYKVIGVVAPFDDEESKEEINVDDLEDGKEVKIEDEEKFEESFKRSRRSKKLLKESKRLNEDHIYSVWGQYDEGFGPEDAARDYNLRLVKLAERGDQTLYKFVGSKEDFDRAKRDGLFYYDETAEDIAYFIDRDHRYNESLKESADINEYQKWVDYDMEKYHKISGNTMNKIKKAGFSVVKDQYGDYEVIADRKDEACNYKKKGKKRLKEATDEVVTVGLYGGFDSIIGFSSVKSLIEYLKSKGLKVLNDEIDYDDESWEMDLIGDPHTIWKEVTKTIRGYDNNSSMEDWIAEYRIDDADESLKESIDDVTIGLDDQNVRLHSGEDDTTTITLTKQTDAVAPVPDDMKRDIEMRSEEENGEEENPDENGEDFVDVESEEETVEEEPNEEEPNEEEPVKRESLNRRARKRNVKESMADLAKDLDKKEDDKFVDVDVKEFDEESFDELGESFLKNVYNNVESFKTSSVAGNSKNIVVEGTIKFTSGNEKKTKFVFEAKDISKRGKVRFYGMNENFANSKRPFIISGKINNAKFIVESMNYNYMTKVDGKSQRISGSVSLKEEKAPKVDLTKIKGTVANLFSKYLSQMEGKSKEQIISDVEKMFKDNNLDTQYTRKKLLDLRKARTAEQVMQQIADSVNYSAGDGVIHTRKSY